MKSTNGSNGNTNLSQLLKIYILCNLEIHEMEWKLLNRFQQMTFRNNMSMEVLFKAFNTYMIQFIYDVVNTTWIWKVICMWTTPWIFGKLFIHYYTPPDLYIIHESCSWCFRIRDNCSHKFYGINDCLGLEKEGCTVCWLHAQWTGEHIHRLPLPGRRNKCLNQRYGINMASSLLRL